MTFFVSCFQRGTRLPYGLLLWLLGKLTAAMPVIVPVRCIHYQAVHWEQDALTHLWPDCPMFAYPPIPRIFMLPTVRALDGCLVRLSFSSLLHQQGKLVSFMPCPLPQTVCIVILMGFRVTNWSNPSFIPKMRSAVYINHSMTLAVYQPMARGGGTAS